MREKGQIKSIVGWLKEILHESVHERRMNGPDQVSVNIDYFMNTFMYRINHRYSRV